MSLRRATARVLSCRPSAVLVTQARSFKSYSTASSRREVQFVPLTPFQRRFVSENAATQSTPNLEPTTEEKPQKEGEAVAAETVTAGELPQTEEGAAAAASVTDVVPESLENDMKSSDVASGVSERRARGNTASPPQDLEVQKSATVYVGNLFFDVKESDLQDEFSKAGPVRRARLIIDRRGLSKGFGYIEFEDLESSERAIEMFDQQNFEGRRLTVQYAIVRSTRAAHQERPPNAPSKTLFIGNLNFSMTDRELNALFREIKNVIDVRVAIDRRTGQPRGFAHADFADVESAKAAFVALRGQVVSGRTLRVDYSTSSGRSSLASDSSAE